MLVPLAVDCGHWRGRKTKCSPSQLQRVSSAHPSREGHCLSFPTSLSTSPRLKQHLIVFSGFSSFFLVEFVFAWGVTRPSGSRQSCEKSFSLIFHLRALKIWWSASTRNAEPKSNKQADLIKSCHRFSTNHFSRKNGTKGLRVQWVQCERLYSIKKCLLYKFLVSRRVNSPRSKILKLLG